jgi:hypothetical protein
VEATLGFEPGTRGMRSGRATPLATALSAEGDRFFTFSFEFLFWYSTIGSFGKRSGKKLLEHSSYSPDPFSSPDQKNVLDY